MKFPLSNGHSFGPNPLDVRSHDGNDSLHDQKGLTHWQRRFQLLWNREAPVTGRFDGPTQRACLTVQREYELPMTAVLDAETWAACLKGPREPVNADHDVPVGLPTPKRAEAPEGVSAGSTGTERSEPSGATKATVPDVPNDVPKTAEAPERLPGASADRSARPDGATVPHPETPKAPEKSLPEAPARDSVAPSDVAGIAASTVPDWFTAGKPVGMGASGEVVRKIRELLGMQPRDKWGQDLTNKVRAFQKANDLPATGWVDTRTACLLDDKHSNS